MPEVDDFFELETDEGEDAASYLDPGAWARTPAKPVRLGGAPRAVLHLVLRDGDAMFASERQPWAEVTVNGRAVAAGAGAGGRRGGARGARADGGGD